MQVTAILSSIVFLVPSGTPSRILNLYRTKWTLAFVCFSFLVYTSDVTISKFRFSIDFDSIFSPK